MLSPHPAVANEAATGAAARPRKRLRDIGEDPDVIGPALPCAGSASRETADGCRRVTTAAPPTAKYDSGDFPSRGNRYFA
ncbi:hypothetical protein GCM10027294_31490 [Marinactinospora endophytica]